MSRSLLERLKSMQESADAAGIRRDRGFNVVQIFLLDLDKILAFVDAFKELDLRCDADEALLGERPCGDCKICRVNERMAELEGEG